jgi:SnoaL-like domain
MSDTVEATIARFANCFDLKDWAGLEAILEEKVALDYSALRGEVGTVTRTAYVEKRRIALDPLATHHLLGNLEIRCEGEKATCRASGVIYRRSGDRFFDSHVVYDFGLLRRDGKWRIAAIKQAVLWNDGDPALHAGASSAGR